MAAEESGRSSAHCNLLDVLHGYAMVQASTSESNHENFQLSSTNSQNSTVLPWENLACFAFGSHWYLGNANTDNTTNNSNDRQSHLQEDDKVNGKKNCSWNAPYLDKVPLFPIKRDRQSTHLSRFGRSDKKIASYDTLQENEDRLWGQLLVDTLKKEQIDSSSISQTATSSAIDGNDQQQAEIGIISSIESKQLGKQDDAAGSPASKRAKLDQSAVSSSVIRKTDEKTDNAKKDSARFELSQEKERSELSFDNRIRSDIFVPTFCPPFPASHTFVTSHTSRSQTSKVTSDRETSQVHQLRKNLIRFADSSESSYANDLANVSVPFGNISSSAKSTSSQYQTINPLQRPSGTRVSRILEGSLDVAK